MEPKSEPPKQQEQHEGFPPQSLLPRSVQPRSVHRKVNRPKRRVRNFFLQPSVQAKLGFYSVALTAAYIGASSWLIYSRMNKVTQTILDLTDVESEVREIVGEYLSGTVVWIVLISLIFAALNIVVSIIYTHRFVGPTIAFRRHIRRLAEGDYNAETHLRKGDAFEEVAESLNLLSKVLKRRGIDSAQQKSDASHHGDGGNKPGG